MQVKGDFRCSDKFHPHMNSLLLCMLLRRPFSIYQHYKLYKLRKKKTLRIMKCCKSQNTWGFLVCLFEIAFLPSKILAFEWLSLTLCAFDGSRVQREISMQKSRKIRHETFPTNFLHLLALFFSRLEILFNPKSIIRFQHIKWYNFRNSFR